MVSQSGDDFDITVVNESGDVILECKGYGTSLFMTGMDEELIAPLQEAVQ